MTLGHFAKVLVDGQAKALEASALTRPLTQEEYDLACHFMAVQQRQHLTAVQGQPRQEQLQSPNPHHHHHSLLR